MANITRIIQQRISQRLKPNKVILLFGARRVGKTILLRDIVADFSGKSLILNGEDSNTLSLLDRQTVANYRQLLEGIELLVIDEAQNIPNIGQKLKLIVDEIDGIRVIASGSSSFDLLNKTGEPLVGRSTSFLLFPFSQSELSAVENPFETRANLESRLIYGSYPELTQIIGNEDKIEYLRDIVNAYLLKDILTVEGLKNSSKMKDLLRLIAFQMGNEVSYDELGRQLGMVYCRESQDIATIILTGEGDKAFCAGGDQNVKNIAGYIGKDGVPRLNVLDLQKMIRSIPKPVVAMSVQN